MIVAVNKLDLLPPNLTEIRYKEVIIEVKSILMAIGYDLHSVVFLPLSGLTADNLHKKSDKIAWFNGPSLVQAIDMLPVPQRPFDLPLRMPIHACFKISGVGTVALGRVETGKMKPGMNIAFCPGKLVQECKTIEIHQKVLNEALPGDNIGFNVRNVNSKQIQRGLVASDAENKPASEVVEFEAQVVIMNHPNEIKKGYTPIMFVHTAMVAVRIEEIKEKVDRRTGQVVDKNPESIKTGDAALVRFVPTKPLCIEAYMDYAPLGRFILRDMQNTIGVGIVRSIKKKVASSENKDEAPKNLNLPTINIHNESHSSPVEVP